MKVVPKIVKQAPKSASNKKPKAKVELKRSNSEEFGEGTYDASSHWNDVITERQI